jgi:uncharacterized protein YndB with AHSA1/START domain
MIEGQTATVVIEPIVKTVEVPLSAESAFRLFTEGVGRWWPLVTHSVFGEGAATCHMELRAGGRFYERHRDGRESEWGIVQASVEAPDVEVVFVPYRAGTRVTLTHNGWERCGDSGLLYRQRYDGGWVIVLNRYAAFSQGGRIMGDKNMNADHERVLTFEAVIPAALEQVWEAWTTPEGALTFFAPAVNVEARPDGRYEMLFNLDAPEGQQGGEGLRVLAIQPCRMLSFTWNAPPHLDVRNQRTHVTVRLELLDDGQTRVTLRHDGWGEGGDWDAAFDYFVAAWGDVILPRLKYRFVVGPVDWSNRPSLDELSRYR